MACLDSDVLINFLRNDRKTVEFVEKLRSEGKNLSTTSINSFELLKGIHVSSKINKEIVIEFLNNFTIYNFEFEASKKAAEIFLYLKSKGDLIELPDIMIASIVKNTNESLITENITHFNRIPNLKIETINI